MRVSWSQVQGVLTAAAAHWPHIFISDSLVMADRAVQMAAEGCESVAVLGVDFMTENVRAVMDGAGYDKVKVTLGDRRPLGAPSAVGLGQRRVEFWLLSH